MCISYFDEQAFPMNDGSLGMSLVDYFAGQAMHGKIQIIDVPEDWDDIGVDCYDIAMNMITERRRLWAIQEGTEESEP